VGVAKKVFGKSIEVYKTNKNLKKHQHILQKCRRGSFVRFDGVRVGVATLRLCIYNLYAESQPSSFYSS